MKVTKTYKSRLYPTKRQQVFFNKTMYEMFALQTIKSSGFIKH